ncbi:Txe/YoeB family addiction module toxin [Photobacterium indicum]|uniref:Txe/YoeB family addiction module toxin n=1 Tax=Photobacterium indicum TaxID=81447 RepID=UPI003D0D8675
MTRLIAFSVKSLTDYNEWALMDKKVFKRIGKLIVSILRDPYQGEGKPEPLKHNLSGYWSRRITQEHRLVYQVTETHINIVSCKEHYS